ncbi:MAG: type II CRISPR RNA-guided endonuclease Cas9, partial [Bacteroidota bacterium]
TGEYFLEQIKNDPNYRVRQRVLDRQFFIDELKAIWDCQKKYHPELSNTSKLTEISQNLYKHNIQKQKEITANDLFHVIVNDIIYYQRDLKSQKSSIGDCRFEKKNVKLTDSNNNEYSVFLKVAPVSHPLFQVFRIWKTIHNLKILELQKIVDGKIKADVDVTSEFLTHETKAKLFHEFDSREKIKASTILTTILKLSKSKYRLNYSDEAEFPGNETKHFFRKAFKRFDFKKGEQLLEDQETLEKLWHLFYSVADSQSIANTLQRWFEIDTETSNKLSLLPPFSSKYGAYSQKALRKLIQVMECGEYWKYENLNVKTQKRIQRIIDGEVDPDINDQTRKVLNHFDKEEDFQGLSETLASYVVYGKHSEREGKPVENLEDIVFPKQNSLRNPIVEQVLSETLKLTKAVFKKYGKPDEIRVEMARDMNRNAKEREKLSKIRDKNRDIKIRISAILRELKIGNPESPGDIEKLRMLEENGNFDKYNNENRLFKKEIEPTKAEIDKYKMWIEQNCVSPYTGKPIMLTKLFTSAYEVEHIIPRSRYFDDSLGNKVIVEEWANKEKGNLTAMQYIRIGSAIGKLIPPEDYIAHVNKIFFGKKRRHLLEDQIPKGFIDRQKNDTRYIIRQVNQYLSQFLEKDKIRVSQGEITNELKQKWGLNEMMKKLLIPRFERLEHITGEKLIIRETNKDGQRKIHLQGYEKRIDHRHHALDALITACTTNQHVQYLNTLEGEKDPSVKYKFRKLLKSDKTRDFRLPWKGFVSDAFEAMDAIIVSHKNNNRILSKGINKHFKYVEENGKWVKKLVLQKNDRLFSVKNSLHKETIAGKIKLRKYKSVNLNEAIRNVDFVADKRIKISLKQLIEEAGGDLKKIKKEIKESPLIDKYNKPVGNKIKIWYFEEFSVSRETLNDSFTEKKIIEKVAEYDTQKEKGIKKLLLSHLADFEGKPKLAFTGEGLEKLWKKAGHPITKISTYETIGNKFEIRPGQLVEAAKGTNLFFVIYENVVTGERDYETLGFGDVVAAKMNNLPIVKPREGYKHFTISPNDLVYVPEPDENIRLIDWENDRLRISKRIYKMVSSSGKQCFFVPHNVSKPVIEKVEFGSLNKAEKSLQDEMIKKSCLKINFDNLGNIYL